jgi:hypothetical protein
MNNSLERLEEVTLLNQASDPNLKVLKPESVKRYRKKLRYDG